MDKNKAIEIIDTAFETISFTKGYEDVSKRYSTHNETLTRIDKKIVLEIFERLGYAFKYESVQKDFILEEGILAFKFQLNFSLKRASVVNYLGIYFSNHYIEYPESNLAFIYRRLLKDPHAVIIAPQISSYEDLTAISREIFNIYEAFKKKFVELAMKENK